MASPMFGCIVPGRLAQFDVQQVSENQVVFTVPECEKINHLVIFLTGSSPFPDGFGGSVYLCWPKPDLSWNLLGFISNDKPSAIFKIAKPKEAGVQSPFQGFTGGNQAMAAQIGISVEPAQEILLKSNNVATAEASSQSNFAQFTQKMMENCYNYLSSFAISQSQMTPQPDTMFVPLNTLTSWYQTFQRRFTMDPNFWKNL